MKCYCQTLTTSKKGQYNFMTYLPDLNLPWFPVAKHATCARFDLKCSVYNDQQEKGKIHPWLHVPIKVW